MKKKTFKIGDIVKTSKLRHGVKCGKVVGLALDNPYGVDNPCAIVDVDGTKWSVPFWMLTKIKKEK